MKLLRAKWLWTGEDLFEDGIEWLVYTFDRRHTDLYADETALAHIGEWMTDRIAPT